LVASESRLYIAEKLSQPVAMFVGDWLRLTVCSFEPMTWTNTNAACAKDVIGFG
jgi:hypothetical protein